LQARDRGLYRDITDCGAGGFSSAVGEMGKETGARVYLDRVPLKYEGLDPWEIWLSEAQERLVLAVPPDRLDELLAVFSDENVEATVLGEFTDTGKLEVFYGDDLVGELEMAFMHDGVPRITKQAVWTRPNRVDPRFEEPPDLTDALLDVLSMPNVASKEWVIRQYDHEVQGGLAIKPLQGATDDGPGDACVVQPILGDKSGVIIANGMNPKYGDLDPYWMAALAIDEALRNVVATGGWRERTALLDNFSWGSPDKPDRLGGLVRAAKACYDFSTAFGTPFISGKDSLYNEYRDTRTGDQVAIPGTLLISAICVVEDIEKTMTMDVKRPGDLVYVVGRTYRELGGSHYYARHGEIGATVPHVRPNEATKSMDAVFVGINGGVLSAAHDCSEGGIAVAAAEMAFAGGYGMNLEIRNGQLGNMRLDEYLFSESASRFIVTLKPEYEMKFVGVMAYLGVTGFEKLGVVTDSRRFTILDGRGQARIDATIDDLKESWQKTFRW
ncbi:MAG: AIR synthase-related protein, partial [Candidatus Poribacteria bacterium]|nr:AIR synthase-related protein [Candidatus Poribacteria bacterium]